MTEPVDHSLRKTQPTTLDADGHRSLRVTAVRGFAWSTGQAFASRILSLVGFVVLARLLRPSDYGVVALANVFVIFIYTFAAAGYSQALVQRPGLDQLDLDSVFWIGLGLSTVLAAGMFAAAWPLSWIFGSPELRPILQALSPSLIFVAAGSVHQAVLERRLEFRRLAARTLVSDFVSTCVGITFALDGLGVWSLVVQSLLGVILASLGTMLQSGYRPSPSVSAERFWAVFASSRLFMGTVLMSFFNERADDFFIGSVIGATALGVYTVAYRVLSVLLEVLTVSASRAVFPVFARIQDDVARLQRAYLSSLAVCAMVAFPVFSFIFAAAPDIVTVVFGQRWHASMPVMRILALYAPVSLIELLSGALLQAVGRTRFVLRVAIAGTVLQVAAFAVAVNFGIEWVAASFVIRAYLILPLPLVISGREVGVASSRLVGALAAPTISSIAMGAVVFLAGSWWLSGQPGALHLLILIVAATGLYPLLLLVLGRGAVLRAIADLRGVTKGGGAAPSST